MFSAVLLTAASAALVAGMGPCTKPQGTSEEAAGYACAPAVDEQFADLAAWTRQYGDWVGAKPAVIHADNAYLGSPDADATLRIRNEGDDWVDERFKGDCDSHYKSLSHGILASTAKYGEGFYEARVRTASPSPFMAAFWLQGAKGEINVSARAPRPGRGCRPP